MRAALLAAAVMAISAATTQEQGRSPSARWDAANRAYRAGEFERAGRMYADLARDYRDPRIEANLAAALWRSGERGAALLHYTRALELTPRDRRIRADLDALRDALGNPPEREPAWRAPMGWLRTGEVLMLLLALNAMTAVAVAFGRRRLAMGAGLATALVAALVFSHADDRQQDAVVLRDVAVRGIPDGPVIATLPEGSIVTTLDSEGGFARVRTAGLPAGWVDSADVARLHFDADDRSAR